MQRPGGHQVRGGEHGVKARLALEQPAHRRRAALLAEVAALHQLGALPFEKAELAFKATFPPAELPGLLAGGVLGRDGQLRVHAGTGVAWLASSAREGDLRADHPAVPRVVAWVAETRERLAAVGGGLVVVKAPAHLKRELDVWGPPGDALGLMRRVKERFDPGRRMSPGRFVGGI
jgi:glycolate oxidase FAD binding subunit